MAFETTLVLVKPDGVERALVGRIVTRLEEKGFELAGMKMLKAGRPLLEQHYAEHKGKPFYEGLVAFMGGGPVVALAVRGLKAVEIVRALMGKTNSAEALPGTIRGDFGLSRSFNLIHGSDSLASAHRELALWFKPDELLAHSPTRTNHVVDRREEG